MITEPVRPNSKVAFFHVMKTGGMTFRKTLETLYGDSFRVSNETSIEGIQKELDRFDCLEFHVIPRSDHWVSPHAGLMQERRWDLLEGREVFTMLRDPFDQFVSQYYYTMKMRAEIEPILNAQGRAFPESILGFANFNNQLGFLAGKVSGPARVIDRDDLERTKEMLIALRVHVGLTERFADSMNVFETVIGMKIAGGAIRIENENSGRPSVSPLSASLRENIRERSKLDFELYEFGRELFLEDIGRCPPTREYNFIRAADRAPAAAATKNPADSGVGDTTAEAIFLHVVATKGMTYRRHLTQMYGQSYHLCDDPTIEAVEAGLKRFNCVEFSTLPCDGDFVHMHTKISRQNRWELLEDKFVFTLLRDPVEHLINRYFLMARMRGYVEPLYMAKGMCFPQSLEEFLDRKESRNHQLGTLVAKQPLLGGTAPDRRDLDEIKAILLQLKVHIGLTEHFEDSLQILQAATGRQIPVGISDLDRNPGCPPLESISAKIKDRIRAQSALDIELYEFGKELFLADCERYAIERRST